MRQSIPTDTNDDYQQLNDSNNESNAVPVAQDSHNASTTPFYTDSQQYITSDTRRRIKEIPELSAIDLARFWSRVEVKSDGECWIWTGAKALASPYSPDIFYGNFRGLKVHRIAYSILVGPIPNGLTIDHVKSNGCTSTLCCNPAHLEAITQTEQVNRRDAGKIDENGMTRCKWGHPRPRGRKAKCAVCARRFVRETLARRRAENPEAVRAKQAANRKRQRAAQREREKTR